MLVRYVKAGENQAEELAKIYTLEEHGIKRDLIDYDAVKVINRLRNHGYQAYIVGGAVRDLLIGRRPKDYDVVTDAHPGKIHKIFWNSRIIGRRFRLVHVYAGAKILEVSTFRSSDLSKRNSFGTMREDAIRRDFSCNGLYYCPEREQIFDYVGGFEDVRDREIVPILPLETIFLDDPVRIIRAVRYAMITGFTIGRLLKRHITRDGAALQGVSSSRLTEEVLKIVKSGKSEQIFSFLLRYNLLPFILPELAKELNLSGRPLLNRKRKNSFFLSLKKMDRKVKGKKETPVGEMLASLVANFMEIREFTSREEKEQQYKEVFRKIKKMIQPITPPNKDVEEALRLLYVWRGLSPPKKKRYGKAPRKKR